MYKYSIFYGETKEGDIRKTKGVCVKCKEYIEIEDMEADHTKP